MKKFLLACLILSFQLAVFAQTTLPTSWNFSTPGISNPPAGYTMALGTNGNLTYGFGIGDALSARLDATGEFFSIQFTDKPGPLSYYLSPQNAGAAWGGQFDIQESVDGNTWTTLRSVTYKASTATNYTGGRYQETLAPGSRFVRFYYTTKLPGGVSGTPGGNMGVDSVWIQKAPAPPYPTLNVKKGGTSLISQSTFVIGNASITQFILENLGTVQTLNIDSVRFSGPAANDFSFGSLPSSILANSSAGMALIFGTSGQGTRLATMKIYCNDTIRSPFVLNLYGIGGSLATEPVSFPNTLSFSHVKAFGFEAKFGYSGSKPEKFIVLRRKGSAITDLPVDGTNYLKGDYIGAAQVEKICDSIETLVPTKIHANSTYYYAVFSFNGPAGFENYNQSNYATANISTVGKNAGTYYNGINPSLPNFVNSLSAKINPHDTVYYSNYISRIVNPWITRDTLAGKKVVSCVYTNHQFVYEEPFQWANGSNGAVLTREHTWPQSWMPTNTGNPDWPNAPGTNKELPEYNDVHNLFPAHQVNANAKRSNNPFDEVVTPTYTSPTGWGVLGKDSANRTVYEPRPEQKGDIARAIFYMATCYHGISGKNWSVPANQNIALLKQWHQMDPPDNLEIARHEFAAITQGNRNPFIDHPEWADRINFSNMSYIPEDTGAVKKPVIELTAPLATDIWGGVKNSVVSWTSTDVDSVEIWFSEDSLKTRVPLTLSYPAKADSFVVLKKTYAHPTGIVIVKDKKSAAADTSSYFKLSMVDGLNKTAVFANLEVFPNPFNEIIFIQGPMSCSYTLSNQFGEVIRNDKIFKNGRILTADLPTGVYILKIVSENEEYTCKLVKVL